MLIYPKSKAVAACCLISISVASECQPRPVHIPVQDVLLENRAKLRGASLSVGTPPQNISFLVSCLYNETYVFGTNLLCPEKYDSRGGNHSPEWCETFRGGSFAPGLSTTASNTAEDYPKGEGFRDVLNVTTGGQLGEIAFGILNDTLQDPYEPRAQLGLGRNSSLLYALKDAGKIGSRSYSYYQGRQGDDSTQGSLMLGGLDESLMTDKAANYTAPLMLDDHCETGMKIHIEDMTLNFKNGTTASIFNEASTAVSACLRTGFAGLMTMPPQHWERFRELAGGRFLDGEEDPRAYEFNFRTLLYDADDVYDGDLTMSLGNGFSIRIPNNVLVAPHYVINEDTGHIERNRSAANLLINAMSDSWGDGTHMMSLGRWFFSAAYTSVNHDAGTFTLWQAPYNPLQPSVKALAADNSAVEDFCDGDGDGSLQDPANEEVQSPQQEEKSTLSAGAIAGIVLGALVAIAAILLLILLFLRKKRKDSELGYKGGVESEENPPLPPYHSRPYFDQEPAEMPGAAKYAHNARSEMEDPSPPPQELEGTHLKATP